MRISEEELAWLIYKCDTMHDKNEEQNEKINIITCNADVDFANECSTETQDQEP